MDNLDKNNLEPIELDNDQLDAAAGGYGTPNLPEFEQYQWVKVDHCLNCKRYWPMAQVIKSYYEPAYGGYIYMCRCSCDYIQEHPAENVKAS